MPAVARSLLLTVAAALTVAALAAAGGAAGSPSGEASAKPTRISCLNKGGSAYRYKRKPRSCAIFGPGGAFAGGVDLKKLAWTGWGRKTAKARGVECGFDAECSDIDVKVKAYRRRTGCNGKRAYTRIKATSQFGTTVARVPRCPGPAS
jgi:hypothetical protein